MSRGALFSVNRSFSSSARDGEVDSCDVKVVLDGDRRFGYSRFAGDRLTLTGQRCPDNICRTT